MTPIKSALKNNQVCSYYGGDLAGVCLQITPTGSADRNFDGCVRLTLSEASELITVLQKFCNEEISRRILSGRSIPAISLISVAGSSDARPALIALIEKCCPLR